MTPQSTQGAEDYYRFLGMPDDFLAFVKRFLLARACRAAQSARVSVVTGAPFSVVLL